MRIKAVRTYILMDSIDEAFAFSQWWYTRRTAMLVEIETHDGIVGWGEAYGPPEPNATLVDELFAPHLVGKDPMDTAVIWEFLYNRYRDYGQKGLVIEALSAVDIALWDIKGKALGLPAYKLMGGGIRTKIPIYATGLYRKETGNIITALQEEATVYTDAGFKAIKMKVGFGLADDVTAVKVVREAIGPDVLLMMDANHAYDASRAIQLGRRVEDQEIEWFEEPVPPEDIDGYVQVKQALAMPIAGGECEFTRYGFRNLLEKRAVDIIQPDTCSAGGLSECVHIAAMASAYGVRYNPHVWGSGIALAANLHLLAVLPDTPPSQYAIPPMLEYDQTENPFRTELLQHPIVQRDGFVDVPDRPGLGVEVDRRFIERHTRALGRRTSSTG